MNVRPPTPGDAPTVAALLAAYDESQGAPPDTSADDLLAEWEELDLARDAWLLELDGRLAGYGCVYGRATERLSTDGYVLPDLRGRGIGSAHPGCATRRCTPTRPAARSSRRAATASSARSCGWRSSSTARRPSPSRPRACG